MVGMLIAFGVFLAVYLLFTRWAARQPVRCDGCGQLYRVSELTPVTHIVRGGEFDGIQTSLHCPMCDAIVLVSAIEA